MSKKIIAKGDRLLVKPVDLEEEHHGNIIVPDMGKEKCEIGEVLDVGPGRVSEYGTVIECRNAKKGDIILYPKIGNIAITLRGEDFHMVQDKEVLGVLIDEKE